MTRIALVGNPNCGKTTLFNALTGTHQHVGNWPGVTVERKTGTFTLDTRTIEVIDLPGTYALADSGRGIDEEIAQAYVESGDADVIVNILDATSLSRGLFLTNELAKTRVPLVVAINMVDVAAENDIRIDFDALTTRLGCPVVPLIASRREGLIELKSAIDQARPAASISDDAELTAVYAAIDGLTQTCVQTGLPTGKSKRSISERIDDVVLNRYLAFPVFLAAMYLMFLISINVGSVFIDFFDLAGSALFVELPRQFMNFLGFPSWLTVFIADGVGGGVQLVGTFIPVIGALFLVLSLLEDSGYMARVAFIVDRLLRSLGLPGKSFVPLIVGFGCNVPAVMATRALDSQPDRILTTLMAPYMSCGARLTVYALFATAFFPSNGQNVVFALYIIGIAVAVLSALAVRKHLLPQTHSTFVLELPAYHVPILRNILLQTWQRLKGFVVRAGKAIVIVVIGLNIVNSIGTDGSVGNENTEQSVLSAIGKSITPVFEPMGISQDNWPATVGIFTGIFAKEVVVGTLDALYAPEDEQEETGIVALFEAAFVSIPENLGGLAEQITDPLGLDLGDLENMSEQAQAQDVQINTISAMQNLFGSQASAFAYLLFILLYMPCVATIGVIFKEVGGFWATFSVVWSFIVAYAAAVVAFQVTLIGSTPLSSTLWIASVLVACAVIFYLLVYWGRRRNVGELIEVRLID